MLGNAHIWNKTIYLSYWYKNVQDGFFAIRNFTEDRQVSHLSNVKSKRFCEIH